MHAFLLYPQQNFRIFMVGGIIGATYMIYHGTVLQDGQFAALKERE